MEPSTQSTACREAPRAVRSALALVLAIAAASLASVAACGGTTGLENISVDPPSDDASADPADPLDACPYDRSVPQRPPPQDTGISTAPSNDAATHFGDAGAQGEAGADAGPVTTLTLLAAQSPDCLTVYPDGGVGGCVATNGCLDPAQQGGVCETVPGMAPSGMTEVQLCIQTLSDLLSSRCAAASLSLTPCLCGQASPMACFAGTATPTGPVYPDYLQDFGPDIHAISGKFTNPLYGAGQANAIVACLLIYNCVACLGEAPTGPTGGPGSGMDASPE
jgi:hypothetical protein